MYRITRDSCVTAPAAAAAPSPAAAHSPHAPPPQQQQQLLLTGIATPQDLDILCGRGGASFRHKGNQIYRDLCNRNKEFYASCSKAEKPKIARSIVAAIRERNGRFLEQQDTTASGGLWFDIGDKKAIEKTSQALREGQAKRKQQIIQSNSSSSSSETGAIPSPGVILVPPPTRAAEADHYEDFPTYIVEQQQQQQRPSRPSILLEEDDDAILQHLDSIMNLSVEDDVNEEEQQVGQVQQPPPAALESQDSRFSLMSGLSSAFGPSTMSIGTLQTLEESSSPTSNSVVAAGTAANDNRRSSASTLTRSSDAVEDGMPAVYMVESSSIYSNISGLSGYSNKTKQAQHKLQQQHWSAGVAAVPHSSSAAADATGRHPLPVVLETGITSEITVMRPAGNSMLTDDFYQQAKQEMMSSSVGGNNKNHINKNNNNVDVAVPPVPQFHNNHRSFDKNSSSSSSSSFQKPQQRPGLLGSMNSLMQDAMLESSFSLQSNMSALTMTTFQTATTTATSEQNSKNITQRQQPWQHRMPTSSQQQAVEEEEGEEDPVLDAAAAELANDDDNKAANNDNKSTFSIMSGMSQISIGDQSLGDATSLFEF